MGRSLVRAVFFLASVAFITRNAGEMTHQLERTIGLLFFLVFCVSFFERQFYERRWGRILLGVALIVAGLVALGPDPPTAAAAVALMTVGVWLLADGLGVPGNDAPPCALTAFLFAVLLLLGRAVPSAWYAGRWFADLACAVSNEFTPGTIDFRPTMAGLPVTALLLLFWLARWLYAARREWGDLVTPILLTLAVQIIYLVVAAHGLAVLLPIIDAKAGVSAENLRGYELVLKQTVPWNLPFLLFLMNVPIVVWVITRRREDVEPFVSAGDRSGRLLIGVAAFAISIVLVSWSPFGRVRPQAEKPIVFYERGFLNWSVPAFDGFYGPQSAGMFGNLLSDRIVKDGAPPKAEGPRTRFVESLGLKARMAAQITSSTLEGASALVIINPNEPWTEGTTETIWRFVEQGGALLLLGDHTAYDEKTGRVYVNELLQPCSIRYNFDSATFAVGGWLHGYDFQWHPLTARLGDERNEAGVVIGASLDIRPPAYPVVLGRYGFEDPGNRFRSEHAFMGDSRFDLEEPLGDTVLVAAQRYGRGKVLVFGDTSGFVNGIVVSSHEFVGRVFRWIAAPGRHALGRAVSWFVVLPLLVVAAVLLLWKGPPGPAIVFVLSLVVVFVPGAAQYHWARAARQPPRGHIAYIDAAHFPIASQEGARDHGLMGLQLNLMRNGLLTFNLFDFDEDAIRRARLLVIVAPAKSYTEREARIVRGFLEKGGVVILSVGAEETYASRLLFAEFGVGVGVPPNAMPLGFFSSRTAVLNAEAQFWEAWRLVDRTDQAKMICGHGEIPVMYELAVGAGRLILIGDSQFFLNENLEAEKSRVQKNIDFLRALLAHVGLASEAAK